MFAHNDPADLEARLARARPGRPKLVAFESLYSMNGDVAPLRELLAVARRHGALTYVDETHAVGVHGPQGGGLLEAEGLLDQVDVVQGGLGKGFGVVGGFVTGRRELIDFVRSHAPGFIFTTALPPATAAAALASVRHLRGSQAERLALWRRVTSLRGRLEAAGLPLRRRAPAQILPLVIGDSRRCTDSPTGCCASSRSTCSRSTSRPCRAAPSDCASRPRRCTTTRMEDQLVQALTAVRAAPHARTTPRRTQGRGPPGRRRRRARA